jgi:hypothetical protein
MKDRHAWIGRKPCGCCMAVRTDENDADTYQTLVEWNRSGLVTERVTWGRYREIANEETFMKCSHGQLKLPILA